ncbi:beta strand repeat-containing protein [Synoicihabitans lomoniglobus]|uniref:Calx-beta domain-containing protein n=1 Tax=Synoicihabitans lomoniglobus TaxID=2909285 RepID=A0AAE9ZWI1_9BACT|nr:hypothetical protein [Opitutaceae bacterium LMO-M01]WED64721.1 Calx-beta domain-containing protein [Opitutaceae bacterium LMO-M01]
MNIPFQSLYRALLCACGIFCSALSVSAATYYLTPAGSGSQNGSSWSNAYALGQLQTTINALAAGDTLNLGSGTYNSTAVIDIKGAGSSGNLRTITGVDTGGGLPLFQGNYDVNVSGSSSKICFRFPGSQTASYWLIKDIKFTSYSWVVSMPLSGSTYTLRSNITFENLDADGIEELFQIRNATQILIKDCDAIRYCKKAFRYDDYTSFLTIQNCTADATGGDDDFPTRAIPAGFCGMNTPGDAPIIHDIALIDCTARNNRYQPQSSYWNGDGFSTEAGTYNVTYTRCKSFDNHDGGFDDKADDVTYDGCISIGNQKGFRYWGDNGNYVNCLAAYNQQYGGTGNSDGLWVGKQSSRSHSAYVHVSLSTFHNNAEWALESYEGGQITATDCIVSVDGDWTNAYLVSSGPITLSGTAQWRTSSSLGPDPQYVAPSRTWTGSPADAFNSELYEDAKGYFGQGGAPTGPVVSVTATDGSAAEPSNNGTFTLTASPAPEAPLTVNLTLAGTATNGTDYSTIASTVTIGTSGTATIDVAVIDDSVSEVSETVLLSVASGTGYSVGSPSGATVTIADNEPPPPPNVTIVATDSSAGEPSNNGTFTLTASPAPTSAITVNLSVAGTATNGTDYSTIGSSVTIGTSGTATVGVAVIDDAATEGSETVILTVGSGTGYTVGSPATATVTISASDTPPSVNISTSSSSAAEGGGSGRFAITAIPSPASPISVTLTITGTAINGTDYTTIPTSVTLYPGPGTAEVDIDAIDDALFEGTETVVLTVASGSGYAVGSPSSATVTINDNDSGGGGGSTPVVTISATDSSAGEPSNNGTFTLTASPAPSSPITVNLGLAGTATNGSDYSTIASTVTIGTGGTATVNVAVTDDAAVEGSETVVLAVNSGSGYTIGGANSATVTIADDDTSGTPVVTISATDSSAGEPSNNGTFTLTASPAPSSSITVNLSLAGTATNGADYSTIASTVTIGTGGTATVTVAVINDSSVEGTETVVLTVNSGSGYDVGGADNATVNIADDDSGSLPQINISTSSSSASEGGGTGRFAITAMPSPSSAITVNLSIAGTATNGVDYDTVATTVTINPGLGTAEIDIDAIDDSVTEGTESVVLTIAAGSGYTVSSQHTATVTINDNDS